MSDGNGIPPEKLELCISITKSLIDNHPGSSMFSKPVDETVLNYYRVISNPQDLGTILKRLNDNVYKSISEWEEDVNTVWSNAEKYNGKNSFVNLLAEHLSREFQHYKKKLDIMDPRVWTNYVYELQNEFEETIEQCPKSLGNIIKNVSLHNLPNFTAKEMTNFLKASEMVNTKENIEKIEKIIKKNEPNLKLFNDVNILDVNSLSPCTLHKIRDYYRVQLTKSGKHYPNE